MNSSALIDLVKQYPALYSKQQSAKTSIEYKNEIWKTISGKINQPVEKCKAKWRNLRDSYQKAIKYRQELETIGREELYREYKHENSLSFLEVGTKRKNTDGDKRSKQCKKSREEYYETSYSETQDCLQSDNIEYIVESEQENTECRVEDDDEEQSIIFKSGIADEEQFQVVSTDNLENEQQTVKSEEHIEQTIQESKIEENESTPNEEFAYQEVYPNEQLNPPTSELDPWLRSLKETLLSLPKVMRARAKKNINDIVSDLEITYLESIELDRS